MAALRVPLSPLRYPGGKTRFVPHLLAWLPAGSFEHVIEPFAGGASVSLGLLHAQRSRTAVISDIDPLIAAFWCEATDPASTLRERLAVEPVTVTRWHHWKNLPDDSLSQEDAALKTIFLNRTTFSGLIRHGSVLGGLDQDAKIERGEKVKYPIDCRFNKPALDASLTRIGTWGGTGNLHAAHADYQDTLTTLIQNPHPDPTRALIYLDPPYVRKSQDLYRHPWSTEDHAELASYVQALDRAGYPVIVSYDKEPVITDLYRDFTLLIPEWRYGMGSATPAALTSREILITNITGYDPSVFPPA